MIQTIMRIIISTFSNNLTFSVFLIISIIGCKNGTDIQLPNVITDSESMVIMFSGGGFPPPPGYDYGSKLHIRFDGYSTYSTEIIGSGYEIRKIGNLSQNAMDSLKHVFDETNFFGFDSLYSGLIADGGGVSITYKPYADSLDVIKTVGVFNGGIAPIEFESIREHLQYFIQSELNDI